MGDVVALGARLRERREQLGLSQTQAAGQLEVARTAYRLWEMDAARPAPDRWRGIAAWLGISMSAMLLAEQLIDEEEAANAQRLAAHGGMTSEQWDTESGLSEGDYFSQERSMIGDQVRQGNLTAGDAADLRLILERMQQATATDSAAPWHPGDFRKRFPADEAAPSLARAAIRTTAIGIPEASLDDAVLIASELVTNSAQHGDSDWIEVLVVVRGELLRVEVSDQSTRSIRPRTPGHDGGWGLAIVSELATRWGVERKPGGKTIWFELDLDPSAV